MGQRRVAWKLRGNIGNRHNIKKTHVMMRKVERSPVNIDEGGHGRDKPQSENGMYIYFKTKNDKCCTYLMTMEVVQFRMYCGFGLGVIHVLWSLVWDGLLMSLVLQLKLKSSNFQDRTSNLNVNHALWSFLLIPNEE